MTNTLTIKDIIGIFKIPSYQRGYKWRKRDVEYLINDLMEYNLEKPYYMQPLVVAKKNGEWIVVDGQQRLTTFYLLWHIMEEKGVVDKDICGVDLRFELLYEKRDESTKYLKTHKLPLNQTPDVRHFINTEKVAIESIAKLKDKKFQKNFFNQATFLWYELEDSNEGPKLFERLNGKRIALTDIELCKVLLLSSEFTPPTKRTERGMAWQMMEYALQNNSFYSFISTEDLTRHDKSRMDIVLKAVCENGKDTITQYQDNPIYEELKARLRAGENIWNKIIFTFHVLERWYQTNLYYNIIGFLIHGAKKSLKSIIDDASSDNFEEKIFSTLKSWIGNPQEIRALQYKDTRTEPILLLFNILCDLHKKKGKIGTKLSDFDFNHKFPFDLYYSDNYDKEHVHATNSKMLSSGIERQQWANITLKYLVSDNEAAKNAVDRIGPSNMNILRDISNASISHIDREKEHQRRDRLNAAIAKIIGNESFAILYDTINAAIEQINDNNSLEPINDFEGDQNSIGNMALLNVGINRDQAYAASPFAVKASILKDKIERGFFVPEGTKAMFFKSFRDNPTEMYHWRKTLYLNGEASDKDAFIDYIIDTIMKIFK